MSANRNVTVYDNRGEDCCKSILMYGNVIDAVVDKNVLHDTDGIVVWGSNSNGQGLPADMYVSFRNNHVSGVSPLTKNTSIDVTSGRFISGPFGEAGSYSCTMVYGVDIRGNTVVGSPEIGEDQVVPNETEAAPWQGDRAQQLYVQLARNQGQTDRRPHKYHRHGQFPRSDEVGRALYPRDRGDRPAK